MTTRSRLEAVFCDRIQALHHIFVLNLEHNETES